MPLDSDTIFPTNKAEDEFFIATKDKGVVSYPVGSDLVPTVLGGNTTAETTLLNLTIAPNSVINGIKIKALVSYLEGADATSETVFRVRAGTLASEATIWTSPSFVNDSNKQQLVFWIEVTVTDLNWSAQQSVLITGDQLDAGTTDTGGLILLVEGF